MLFRSAREAGLRIDGQMVLPILDRVQAFDSSGPGNAEPALQFDLRYPCSGMPRTVEVTWSIFEKGADNGVPTLFRQVGGFFEFTAILREEPSYVWHGREQALARPESLQRPVPAARPEERRVGKERRSRCSSYHKKKHIATYSLQHT